MHSKTCDNIKSAQKNKSTFSRLLRHPVWKWSGSILKEKIGKGGYTAGGAWRSAAPRGMLLRHFCRNVNVEATVVRSILQCAAAC